MDVEVADVGAEDECVEVVVGPVASKRVKGGSVTPAFVDVDAFGVGDVGADGEIVTAGRISGEKNGFTGAGEKRVTLGRGNAQVPATMIIGWGRLVSRRFVLRSRTPEQTGSSRGIHR